MKLKSLVNLGTRYIESRLSGKDVSWVEFYVDGRCNLTCDYCEVVDYKAKDPPLEILKRRIELLAEAGFLHLSITGGEPFLRKDLHEVVKHAHDHGLAATITTNGYKLTEQNVRATMEAGLDSLNMSIDSWENAPSRKNMTALFDKLEMVERVRQDYGTSFHVDQVVTKDDLPGARKVIDYCKDNGVLVFPAIVVPFFQMGPTKQDTEDMKDFYRYCLSLYPGPLLCSKAYLGKVVDYLEANGAVGGDEFDWDCAAGKRIFRITLDGRVILCSAVSKTSYGPTLEEFVKDVKGHREKIREAHNYPACKSLCGFVGCYYETDRAFSKPVATFKEWIKKQL